MWCFKRYRESFLFVDNNRVESRFEWAPHLNWNWFPFSFFQWPKWLSLNYISLLNKFKKSHFVCSLFLFFCFLVRSLVLLRDNRFIWIRNSDASRQDLDRKKKMYDSFVPDGKKSSWLLPISWEISLLCK